MELTSDNKLGRGNSEWKGGDATHLDIYEQKASHHGQDSTNDGLATCPAPPSSSLTGHPEGAKSGLTTYRQQVLTVAHQGAAGPATQIATQQHTRWCQRHLNVAHPTATPRRQQEEGGLRSSEGNGGGGDQ